MKVRRTQSSRRQDAEHRILEAAIQLIGEQGIMRTTFEEIGAVAGCSRGLPRHYFGSKENLLVRIATDITDQFTQALLTEEFERANGLDKVLLCLKLYLERAMKRPSLARALLLMRSESLIAPTPLREAIEKGNIGLFDILRGAIEEGQATGEIRPDIDAQTHAGLIGGAVRGLTGLYLSSPREWNFAAMVEEFLRWTRLGLAAADEASEAPRLGPATRA